MKKKLLYLAVALCLTKATAWAQNTFQFTSDFGLSNTQIRSLYEDSRHNVWITTSKGLNCYDGTKINVYSSYAPEGFALLNDGTTAITNIDPRTLLVGTIRGLQLLDYDSGRLTLVPIIRNGGDTIQAHVSQICQLRNGTIYVTTAGYGIFRLQHGKNGTYTARQDEEKNKVSYIRFMMEDSKGRLWMADRNESVYLFSKPDAKQWKTLKINGTVSCITESHTHYIYIGTDRNGLLRYDEQTGTFETVSAVGTQYIISNLYADQQDNIWICTDGNGLFVYNETSGRLSQSDIKASDYKLEASNVKDVLIDSHGNTWVGVYWKGLLIKPNSSNNFQYIGRRSALRNTIGTNCVTAIMPDRDNTLWVATDNCGLYHLDADAAQLAHYRTNSGTGVTVTPNMPSTILSILRDSQGMLWLGSSLGELTRFDPTSGTCTLMSQIVDGGKAVIHPFAICEDAYGTIWIGTNGQWLYGYDLNSRQLCQYVRHSDNTVEKQYAALYNSYINYLAYNSGRLYICTTDGLEVLAAEPGAKLTPLRRLLRGSYVGHVSIDHDGSLWVSTNQGLAHLSANEMNSTEDGEKADYQLLTRADGLPDNFVCATEIDTKGNIWISTLNGMACYHSSDKHITTYNARDGLQGNEFTLHTSARMNGNIYFGGINGITYFNPLETLTERDTRPLELRFSDFYVNNQRVRAGQQSGSYTILERWINETDVVNLCHDDRNFGIEMNTMEFGWFHVTYSYRVNGGVWNTMPQGQNRIDFENIPTGKYRIEVRAESYGRTSDTRTINVHIHPAWYASTFAFIVYALLFLGICFFVWQHLREHIRAKKLEEKNRREAEMNEARTQFFMNISHEIRTPMTLIIAPLEKLMKKDTDPEHQRNYSIIHINAQRILRLINQLLDARKIEKGQFTLHYSHTELVGFLQNLYDLFHASAQQHDIDFQFLHEGIDKLYVDIDPQNYDKIVMNLLSNALKFTPDGGKVVMQLECTDAEDDSQQQFTLKVTDTGVGIPKEDRSRVFDRFYSNTYQSGYIGTGIGLNLTHMLVEMHLGSITVDDNPEGQGTMFTVNLPVTPAATTKTDTIQEGEGTSAQPAESAEANEQAKMPEADLMPIEKKTGLRHRNLMIVEDDPQIRQFLCSELSAATFSLKEFSNGKQAWDYLQQSPEKVDLIVTDLMMPVMDGAQLCENVKQNYRTNHIPVIMLTAKGSDQDRIEGLSIGADAYISKPFNLDVLETTINNLLRQRNLLQGKYATEKKEEKLIDDIELKSPDEHLMERVMKVINENLSNPELNIEFVADKVGISRVHFHRKMKELTGQTPRDYLKSIRMKKASKLLSEKRLDITDVSIATGFKSISTFSTTFKAVFGVTPTEYMKMQHNDSE